jgi:hypothetical protein
VAKFARHASIAIAAYLAAWALAFALVVGAKPSLIASYFTAGWTFVGGELATFVWLLAWPICAVILLAYHLVRRRRPPSGHAA